VHDYWPIAQGMLCYVEQCTSDFVLKTSRFEIFIDSQ
jgi:hypothetical protein